MTVQPIRFRDGAAYDQSMGEWSRLAGQIFLDWLNPAAGLRWLEVGCGSGAFMRLLVEQCAPAEITGIDPSEAQLEFARTHPSLGNAAFRIGHAMDLPFPENRFDAAVMALVIFFIPDPAVAVRELARVVRPGGLVASYGWDLLAGGSPSSVIRATLTAMGLAPPQPPSMSASGIDELRDVWSAAGLQQIETRTIAVSRTFPCFAEFWDVMTKVDTVRPAVSSLTPEQTDRVKARLAERLPADTAGRITYSGRANAISGRVPA